jgi:hypothetical protein
MEFGLPLVVIALAVTAALWATAVVLKRVDGGVVKRGLRNGLVAAGAIFAIVTVLVGLIANGSQFFFSTLDLSGALTLGALVGAALAIGYLWLGAVLVALGLIFRAKPGWTTAGAWAAVPIVVVSAGFGYGAYRSVSDEGARPASYPGTVALQLTGANIGIVSASGPAICQVNSAGDLSLNSGAGAEGTLTSSDGRPVDIGYTMNRDGAQVQIVVGDYNAAPGKGWEPGPDTIAVVAGSTAASGQTRLMNLVPLNASGEPDTTERWSGLLNWTCQGTG